MSYNFCKFIHEALTKRPSFLQDKENKNKSYRKEDSMAKTNNTVKLNKLQVALLIDENFLRRVAERFCQYLLEEKMNNHLKALPY